MQHCTSLCLLESNKLPDYTDNSLNSTPSQFDVSIWTYIFPTSLRNLIEIEMPDQNKQGCYSLWWRRLWTLPLMQQIRIIRLDEFDTLKRWALANSGFFIMKTVQGMKMPCNQKEHKNQTNLLSVSKIENNQNFIDLGLPAAKKFNQNLEELILEYRNIPGDLCYSTRCAKKLGRFFREEARRLLLLMRYCEPWYYHARSWQPQQHHHQHHWACHGENCSTFNRFRLCHSDGKMAKWYLLPEKTK